MKDSCPLCKGKSVHKFRKRWRVLSLGMAFHSYKRITDTEFRRMGMGISGSMPLQLKAGQQFEDGIEVEPFKVKPYKPLPTEHGEFYGYLKWGL